jgi:teichuronic acid biosynthesis glycosyltransferase TuaG
MIDRDQVGGVLMPDYYYDDYALWIDLLRSGHTAIGVQVDMARYRIGRRTVSGSKVRMVPAAWRAMRTGHDTAIGTIPAIAWYALRGLRDARRYRPHHPHTESV